MRGLVLALVLAAGLALAGGRAGYRVEVGQRFTVRVWAEEVVAAWGPLEQVAGAELEYGPAGWYWSPYTGLGWTGGGWWAQVQVRYTPGGAAGVALLGGITW